ncbi:dephospho-CoA kinase [bacterium]|nr:dephospho-CoA kinase [bacterium]
MNTPVIVVTGPIASGKTTVAGVIADDAGFLLDADTMANEVLEEEEVKKKILREFGGSVLTVSGSISRRKLGDIVFSYPEKLESLNNFLYPYVKKRIDEEVLSILGRVRYIVLDAVLFFQYNFGFEVNFVVVTKAVESVRIERLTKRDGIEIGKAEKIVMAQRPLYADWEKGDVTINTDCNMEEMKSIAEKIRNDFLNSNGD